MKKSIYSLVLALGLISGSTAVAQNYNITLASQYAYPNQTLANICGYVDAQGREYSLNGAAQGMDIVDVTIPTAPVHIVQIPMVNDLWKEIKVYRNFAYVTTEGGGGLQIVDLSNLPNTNLQSHFYTGDGAIAGQLSSIHALHIDTTAGFVYLWGSNIGQGGAVILDINADPYNPTYVAQFQQLGYIHDGYVDNDTMYAAHIYTGFFSVVDMTNKNAPVILAQQTTPTAFTHNTWLSDDRNYIFTTDENTNSFLTAYDVSNLNNIQEKDRLQCTPGSGSIVHNTHILHNWAVTSWYKDGINIVDVTRPHNMIEVGRYDTYAGSGNGFEGTWGVYPFLASGTIVVSNIDEGLFVLSPTYVRACYLEGTVTDSTCGNVLTGVTVNISTVNVTDVTNALGEFATGTHLPGTYTVTFSKPGYNTVTINNVVFAPGQVNTYNIQMTSPTAVAVNGQITNAVTTNGLPNVNVVFEGQNNYSFVTNGTGDYNSCSVIADTYTVTSGAWGFMTQCNQQTINSSNNTVNLALTAGWYDDFVFDFGWSSTGTATTGAWERGEPIGTDYISTGDANPELDVNTDCSNQCYVTGNIGGQASQGDVDGGTAILTSPVFDLTGYTNPYVHYDRWFFNAGGQGNPNDSLIISITNGSQTVVLETVTANTVGNSAWQHRVYQLTNVINLTSSMRLIVKTADTPQGHLVEAAFDRFMVVDSSGNAIAENTLNNSVNVYPNPYNGLGVVSFSLAQAPAAGAYLEVTDVAGRIISVMPVVNQQGTLTLSADVPAGIYLVRLVQAGEASASLKLVKTN